MAEATGKDPEACRAALAAVGSDVQEAILHILDADILAEGSAPVEGSAPEEAAKCALPD